MLKIRKNLKVIEYEPKSCIQCNCLVYKKDKPTIGRKEWNNLKFCSKKCYFKFPKDNKTACKQSIANKGKVPHNFSIEIRKKMSDSKKGKFSNSKDKHWIISNEKRKNMGTCKGEKHYLYKKDRNLIKKSNRHTDIEYKRWKKMIHERDGWICKMSNCNCSKKIEAHHILRWAKYPELRYDINNGITLCKFHHPRKEKEEIILSSYFKELILLQ